MKVEFKVIKRWLTEYEYGDGSKTYSAHVILEKGKLFSFIPIRKRYAVSSTTYGYYTLCGYRSPYSNFRAKSIANEELNRCIEKFIEYFFKHNIIKTKIIK